MHARIAALALAVAVTAGIGLADRAEATPVTYGFIGGQLDVTVVGGGLPPLQASFYLDGDSVTFNDMTGSIDNFLYTVNDSLSIGGYGIDSIDLAISLSPGSGYSSSGSETPPGSGLYTVTGGPTVLAGMISVNYSTGGSGYSFFGPAGSETWMDGSLSAEVILPTYTALVDTFNGEIGVEQVNLGNVVVHGTIFSIVADVTFEGVALPEPGLAGLLVLVAAAAGLRRRAA